MSVTTSIRTKFSGPVSAWEELMGFNGEGDPFMGSVEISSIRVHGTSEEFWRPDCGLILSEVNESKDRFRAD